MPPQQNNLYNLTCIPKHASYSTFPKSLTHANATARTCRLQHSRWNGTPHAQRGVCLNCFFFCRFPPQFPPSTISNWVSIGLTGSADEIVNVDRSYLCIYIPLHFDSWNQALGTCGHGRVLKTIISRRSFFGEACITSGKKKWTLCMSVLGVVFITRVHS